MAKTADVIVIGAGIMGCSTAFHLAKRGLAVTVLERETVGAGGTGRSSAIIRQHYSHELTARMALHSLRVFQHFDDAVGGECGFEQTGWVAIAPAKNRAGLEENVSLQQSLGIRTELVTAHELRDLVPEMDASDVVAAAYEPESGYADPHLTVTAYAEAAKRHGATILVGTEVTGVRMESGRVVGVETRTESFAAPIVVNCAGPWAARVARRAKLELPIDSCRVQVAVFSRPDRYGRHPVIMDFIHGVYLRAETGNLTIAGSIDPSEADAIVDPDDYPQHVDDEFVEYVAERFVRRCPPMEHSQSRGGFASLYAVTPDWHPIVDEVPPQSGMYVCSGFSGHGFKLGPAVGLMTADLVTGEPKPRFGAQLFRLDRFAKGESVRGRYEYSIAG